MRLVLTLLFALIFGSGLYFAGEGIQVWHDAHNHNMGECEISQYYVERSEVCTISRKVNFQSDHCREYKEFLADVSCSEVRSQLQNYIDERPVGSVFLCYFENDKLTLYDRNKCEIMTQLTLGLIFILFGTLPFWTRDKKIKKIYSIIACRHCGKSTVLTRMVQIRRGNEPPAMLCKCISCNLQWREM